MLLRELKVRCLVLWAIAFLDPTTTTGTTATTVARAVQLQNEEGDDFYVVEEGVLQCFVLFPGEDTEAEVRTPYVRGESFGELALMYNNPRAAT